MVGGELVDRSREKADTKTKDNKSEQNGNSRIRKGNQVAS